MPPLIAFIIHTLICVLLIKHFALEAVKKFKCSDQLMCVVYSISAVIMTSHLMWIILEDVIV